MRNDMRFAFGGPPKTHCRVATTDIRAKGNSSVLPLAIAKASGY